MSKRSGFGLALMGAVLIKAALTLVFGFTFDPLLSGMAVGIFIWGVFLAISGGIR